METTNFANNFVAESETSILPEGWGFESVPGSEYDVILHAVMSLPAGKTVAREFDETTVKKMANGLRNQIRKQELPISVRVLGNKIYMWHN